MNTTTTAERAPAPPLGLLHGTACAVACLRYARGSAEYRACKAGFADGYMQRHEVCTRHQHTSRSRAYWTGYEVGEEARERRGER